MGRPPLGLEETKVRLPAGVGKRIDALVGEQKRSEFIRRVVLRAVQAAERRRAKAAGGGDDGGRS